MGSPVTKVLEDTTDGRLQLGAETLYGALSALEKKGWIIPCRSDTDRKKEFEITSAGKEVAEKELLRLKALTEFADRIVGGE